MMRTTFAASALVALLATVAPARADMIYSGSCYPDATHTNGQPGMPAYIQTGFGYGLTGTRFTITQPMLITGFSGVAFIDGSYLDYHPNLNIFAGSGSLTREQVFATSPLVGNVYSGLAQFDGAPASFGSSMGLSTYFVQFALTPVLLQPGDYLLSMGLDQTSGSWGWLQTDQSLGSAVYVTEESPGQYFDYTTLGPEYTTGSAAVDIIGTVVPEPASVLLLGMTGALGLRRRRR